MTTFISSSCATLRPLVARSDSTVLRDPRSLWRQPRAARRRDGASVLLQAKRPFSSATTSRQLVMTPYMSSTSSSSSEETPSDDAVSSTFAAAAAGSSSSSSSSGSSSSSSSSSATNDDDDENKTLLNSGGMDSEIPMYHSTLMTAMRDYFGDDGREIQEYSRRPRKDGSTQPLFRLLIMGGDKDSLLARRLHESELTRSLYYMDPYVGYVDEGLYHVVDEDVDMDQLQAYSDSIKFVKRSQVSDDDISKWAQQAQLEHLMENDKVSLDTISRFAKWACVDAVFVGTNVHEKAPSVVMNDIEQTLAKSGITLFQYDVGTAIAEKQLDVLECLSSLISDDVDTTEALIE